ncbi:hypothetical protein MalM25_33140 [Planctomycetes bacterium MalM25]|nr:hypothetical protein MalM25_33140 [Planctomycetes bacterium MalM25]
MTAPSHQPTEKPADPAAAPPYEFDIRYLWQGLPYYMSIPPHPLLGQLRSVEDQYHDNFLVGGDLGRPVLFPIFSHEAMSQVTRQVTRQGSGRDALGAMWEAYKTLNGQAGNITLELGGRFGRDEDGPTYDASDTPWTNSQREAVVFGPGGWSIGCPKSPCFYPQRRVAATPSAEDPEGSADLAELLAGSPGDDVAAAALATVMSWPLSPRQGPAVFVFNETGAAPGIPTVARRLKAVLDPHSPDDLAPDQSHHFRHEPPLLTDNATMRSIGVIYLDARNWSSDGQSPSESGIVEYLHDAVGGDRVAPLVLIDAGARSVLATDEDVPNYRLDVRSGDTEATRMPLPEWTRRYRLPILRRLFDLVTLARRQSVAESVSADRGESTAEHPNAAVRIVDGPVRTWDEAMQRLVMERAAAGC